MLLRSRPINTGVSEKSSLFPPLTASIAAVALAGLVPALLIGATPTPVDGAWFGVLLVIIVAGCKYAWLIGSGSRRLVELSIWLFVYVFLGLAPLVQLRTGIEPITTPGVMSAHNGGTVAVVMVGCLSILIGGAAKRLRGQVAPQSTDRGLNYRRSMILGILALVASVYFVSKVGLGTLFESRDSLALASTIAWPETTTRAMLQALFSMPLLVAFVALVKVRAHRSAYGQYGPYFVLGGVVCALLITVNMISSPRYVVGTALLSAGAGLGLYRSASRFRMVAILAVAALVLAFPLADAFRHSSSPELLSSISPVKTLTDGDYDSFAQINNSVRYVDDHGITNGRQALGVALFWVPRSIWKSKPVDTGILLAESRGYSFTNLSAPLWAELYINGGWPTLALGMGALGWFTRQWDDHIAARLSRVATPGLLACILPFYLILILRGSLLQSMAYLSVILVTARWVSGSSDSGAESASHSLKPARTARAELNG